MEPKTVRWAKGWEVGHTSENKLYLIKKINVAYSSVKMHGII